MLTRKQIHLLFLVWLALLILVTTLHEWFFLEFGDQMIVSSGDALFRAESSSLLTGYLVAGGLILSGIVLMRLQKAEWLLLPIGVLLAVCLWFNVRSMLYSTAAREWYAVRPFQVSYIGTALPQPYELHNPDKERRLLHLDFSDRKLFFRFESGEPERFTNQVLWWKYDEDIYGFTAVED